jgi:hypothetical protein
MVRNSKVSPRLFVQIDVNQTKVDRAGWHNEYDSPIFFVELRKRYACSWCEPQAACC